VLPFLHDQTVRQLGSLTEHINTPHIYFGDTHWRDLRTFRTSHRLCTRDESCCAGPSYPAVGL